MKSYKCRYDGKHYEQCPNNDNGICRTKYLWLSQVMKHPFDGKNRVKCPCG